jgi:D-cysteine desulfhydrase
MYPSNPTRLSLALLPTPLQLLERTSASLGGPRIWVKRDDLTGSVLTGNKVRKLEYLVADALSQSAQVLITSGGLQSNHCRATALVAAQQGLQSHLILRGARSDPADGNLLLDQLAGAAISCYPAAEYQARLLDLYRHWQQEYTRRGLNAYLIPTGGSNAVGVWGYLEAAREMDEQFRQLNIAPDHVICASGSGGTQAGLSLGFSLLRPQLSVLGFAVCDDEAYFTRKVTEDIHAWCARYQPELSVDKIRILSNDRYIGPGYGQAEAEVYDTIARLARTEGLVLDPVYTGKAFHGLLSEIRQGRFRHSKDVVFMHTGGVFGVFPHRHKFR